MPKEGRYWLLRYELHGIIWNLVIVALSVHTARLQAPKEATNVNVSWLP